MEEYQQMSIFDVMYENYKITKPIRLIELFAGIGSQAKALKNIGTNFETYKVVEFDKYAIASYNAIHDTNFNTLDITQISGDDLEIKDTDKYDYIMTYSFPCQDLSLAGKQKGMSKGTSTRSGLLWEVERLLKECKELPQILLMENVPMVHSKDNNKDFNLWINFLESLGYKNYWKDLNAENYGIPQNRNRTFMISILGDYNYNFPKKQKLKLRLKNMLEDEVDEKYYLSDKMIKYVTQKLDNIEIDDFLVIDSYNKKITNKNISGTIVSGQNRNQGSMIILPEATKQGYAIARDGDGVYINRPHQKRGVVQKGMIQTLKTQCDDVGVVVKDETPKVIAGLGEMKSNNGTQFYQQDRVYDGEGIAMCHPANLPNGSYYYGFDELSNLRIRKLTPKECFRLMGFSDEDYKKASKVNSKAQLYKQAGNSIVVNVLMEIFKQLF